MLNACEVLDLGRLDFKEAWKIQLDFVQRRAEDQIDDTLILCEHDPVYTFGRSIKERVPEALPFPGYSIERGGKATYHGPGQLVIYPIVKLPGPVVVKFIREFEMWLIDLLADFDLRGERRPGETGVWIENRKIASIGIAVKRWVTFHGAALNVNPNLSHFASIEPCGYSSTVMTSVSRETGREITVQDVKSRISARNLLQTRGKQSQRSAFSSQRSVL